MITRAIDNCYKHARQRGWAKTYWAFDIHGTILKPNYKTNQISKEFYPYALDVMRAIEKDQGIVKILYTCSYPHEIEEYLEYFSLNGFHFNYVNRNPEVVDGGYGYYSDKFYFNVLLDDKAGFDGETDWEKIREVLKKYEIG
jgi:hypothetical protein